MVSKIFINCVFSLVIPAVFSVIWHQAPRITDEPRDGDGDAQWIFRFIYCASHRLLATEVPTRRSKTGLAM